LTVSAVWDVESSEQEVAVSVVAAASSAAKVRFIGFPEDVSG
jgi:hypothetical protein